MTPPFYHYVFDISFLSLVLDDREGMGTKYYSQTHYLKKVIVRYLCCLTFTILLNTCSSWILVENAPCVMFVYKLYHFSNLFVCL